MSENNKLITKNQKESKAEITVRQNQNEGGEPFEAVIEFKKPGKPSEVESVGKEKKSNTINN
jgi:hypothetical protein